MKASRAAARQLTTIEAISERVASLATVLDRFSDVLERQERIEAKLDQLLASQAAPAGKGKGHEVKE
jgi:uncharacterized coiled-coil protein SlyX